VVDLDNELLERKMPMFDHSSEEGLETPEPNILRSSGFLRQ